MICSSLENPKYHHLELHAEQAFTNVELYSRYSLEFNNSLSHTPSATYTEVDKEEKQIENIEVGVFGKKLTITTLNKLLKYLQNINIQSTYLVVSLNRLDYVQKNIYPKLHDSIIQMTQKGKSVILTNISESVFEQLKLSSLADINKQLIKKDCYIFSTIPNFSVTEFDDLNDELIEDLFEITLIKETGLSSNALDQELNPSSSVYISKFVNAKNLLNNDTFFSYCIYRLAIKMIHSNGRDWLVLPDYDSADDKISLFFQTLNGAYIASTLSDLLQADTCFVDHIGPINKLYNTYFGERISFGKNYIVVADVVCLGTEVKIAKSLIQYNGGFYIGNVSIMRSKTLKDEDRKYTDVVTLFEINKANNEKYKLNYKISADLT
ncbi:MAG: hypothetical protein V1775_06730 [Bacteroidota bacterium]